eukprot:3436771-Prymnesium_polylepis.1
MRHWFELRRAELNAISEEQKKSGISIHDTTNVEQDGRFTVSMRDVVSAGRGRGRIALRTWSVELKMKDGSTVRARATGDREMAELLSAFGEALTLAQGWLDLPKQDEFLSAFGEALTLAQGWFDLPMQDDSSDEIWVRHWFMLTNLKLTMFSEEQKRTDQLKQPVFALDVNDMATTSLHVDDMLSPRWGPEFYKWGIVLET